MIIRIDNGTMWASSPTNRVASIVRSLKTLTTKEIGVPIFQRFYHDHLIRGEQIAAEFGNISKTTPSNGRWIHIIKDKKTMRFIASSFYDSGQATEATTVCYINFDITNLQI